MRLSREAIVGSAMAVADAEGLEAVTIRRLAQEHGVTPMAMYWHFNDKESLLDAMAEQLIASVDLPAPTDEPWDVQLRAILEAILEALRPHPPAASLAARRVLAAEPGLRLADRVLALLARAGLDERRAAQTAMFLLCSVVALIAADPAPRAEAYEDKVRHKKAQLVALSPATYPNVVAAAPELVDCIESSDYYATSLDMLIRGIA
ncbi:regulatory protein TetR [Actinoplanes sp. N902-109]|nr:regulatory protein TetR [Actinoplanes sp. N902-109]